MRGVQILAVPGDVLETPGDVLVLKYAQALLGAEREAVQRLGAAPEFRDLPGPAQTRLVDVGRHLGARRLLLVGTPPIFDLLYRDLRDLGRRSLEALADLAPDARRVLQTIHGTGVGLDEAEALASQLDGFRDALAAGSAPPGLEEIVIVEADARRLERLRDVLHVEVPGGMMPRARAATARTATGATPAADDKPRVFVAMPFDPAMDDLFHYAIQGAVRAAGMVAERADAAHFTGDVMAWVKDRIAGSALVVAELSGANPNVYLEVGYAWGCDVPTVLLIRQGEAPRFDAAGQRRLAYASIKDLEQQLAAELAALFPTAAGRATPPALTTTAAGWPAMAPATARAAAAPAPAARMRKPRRG